MAFDNSCMSPSPPRPHSSSSESNLFFHSLLRVVEQNDAPHWRLAVHLHHSPHLCTCVPPGAAHAICPWDWAAPNTATLSLVQPLLFISVI